MFPHRLESRFAAANSQLSDATVTAMKRNSLLHLASQIVLGLFLCAEIANAQLAVAVSRPKITGNKAVVPLAIKNDFSTNVVSARAACFLTDEQGKMAAQGTRWVVGGGEGKPSLAAGATNAFYFVVASDKPFASTNLTAKISFTRVVLEGGVVADPSKQVSIQTVAK